MFHTLSVCGSSCSDFSFLAERVPGVSFSIGTKHPDHAKGEGTGVQAHNSLFDIDERALPRGSSFLATLAMEFAKKQKSSASDGEL